ncbi:helix-turn-helix domain-containing protein [Aquibacillus sp. 3ASR75-11]|uniref:Helix-turn-helix domain-containing protein n=1 Tax=Terrihalobacillus insolitus TaxID=2950438 RepID=A0A9X3WRT5_9BACI|nr:RodZ family helix-turn-helix domain-containing protein [Terrihalobacillus insolitus]MDC3414072.1 helix-turn-helix domain-containing protein [Terrihalobacillus insolitus]MDC3423513.1 helix-turn-helix domain-containing protein [Terrihalobacillus insolitus]
MEIGARLKEAREAKNITLEELQQITKIQKRYLQAIEKGNFDVMPGRFYVRAFIKEYAAAVGIDSEALMEEYESELPKVTDDSSIQYTRAQRNRKESASSSKSPAIFSFLPSVAVVLLIVGAIFLVWYFYQLSVTNDAPQSGQQDNGEEEIIIESDPEEPNDPEASTDNEESDNNNGGNSETPKEDESDEKPAEKEPQLNVVNQDTESGEPVTVYELVNPGDSVVVEFETDTKSWLQVENGKGKSFYSQTLQADKSPIQFDLTGEEKLYFRVGSAPNLAISINGVPLTYEVDPNEEVLQRIWIEIGNQTK